MKSYWQVTGGDPGKIISFYLCFFPFMILFCLDLAFLYGFSSVWLKGRDFGYIFLVGVRQFLSSRARVQFFLSSSETPWRREVKSHKFQLVPLTIGGESKSRKILSFLIDNSLLTWTGLLDGTRIRTFVNLLNPGIMDNCCNYQVFKIKNQVLKTFQLLPCCTVIFLRWKSSIWLKPTLFLGSINRTIS